MVKRPPERCSMCDDFTGHAGAGEDSLYCECGTGPFCCDCLPEHQNTCGEWKSGEWETKDVPYRED